MVRFVLKCGPFCPGRGPFCPGRGPFCPCFRLSMVRYVPNSLEYPSGNLLIVEKKLT